MRRLFILAARPDLSTQIDWLPELDRLKSLAKPLCEHKTLREQLMELIADRALFPEYLLPRTASQFESQCAAARGRIAVAVQEVVEIVRPLLEAYEEVGKQLQRTRSVLAEASSADVRQQLEELLAHDFLVVTPWEWLKHVPRYLSGIALRLDKYRSGNAARDVRLTEELQPHLHRLRQGQQHMNQCDETDPELIQFRWMLEEYRVSLFAQELGTSLKVSHQRLDRQWERVES